MPFLQPVLRFWCLFSWLPISLLHPRSTSTCLPFTACASGGTFALYSLLCRAIGCNPYGAASGVETSFQGFNSDSANAAAAHSVRSGTSSDRQPPHQQHAEEVNKASWVKRLFRLHTGAGLRLRRKLQSSAWAQRMLLMVVVVATAMVVGDGVLTPAISGEC